MGYENVLFNGKSMRNAIITKLSEDKHLTSALFANSNITILVDILSYMYQCMMSNLRQAANESMWSDTIFFENAARLARLIGYYAKGQMPYTLIAKIMSKNVNIPEFAKTSFGYGPYHYDFAVVEKAVNNDQNMIRVALGEWKQHEEIFESDGSKFQEFVVEPHIDNYDNPAFISQKFVRVFTTKNNKKNITLKDINDHNSQYTEWTYSSDPLFLIQDPKYLQPNTNNPSQSRTLTVANNEEQTRKFNFYIDENGNYILKFGDGLSTSIPENEDKIVVCYVLSTETDKSITPAIKSAISNASEAVIDSSANESTGIMCIPITTLSGYKDVDSVESIRQNSRSSFSRQNRLVTKQDYHDFALETYPEWKDVAVQNNWEFVSSFYGWLYGVATKSGTDPEKIINTNNLKSFHSPDPADANNVYIWVLQKDAFTSEQSETPADKFIGIMEDMEKGLTAGFGGNSIAAIKDITEHPIFLYALCKRFIPFGKDTEDAKGYFTYDSNSFEASHESYFRVHVDPNYSSHLNVIKSKTYAFIKEYLFDNIMLGLTPNISALIKDIMSIDGVTNITTVYNLNDGNIQTEEEINGMRFCTWTVTNDELFTTYEDIAVTYNLPNIPCFQYFESAQTYDDFINKSIEFKID